VPSKTAEELPTIVNYAMTTSQALDHSSGDMLGQSTYVMGRRPQFQYPTVEPWPKVDLDLEAEYRHMPDRGEDYYEEEEMAKKSTKRMLRIVKIYIADRHPDVPLEEAMLYKSPEEFVTDMDNQELFYTIPIMEVLEDHNAKRVTWLDKEATRMAGRDVMLEPIRTKDLDMVVTDHADFDR